MTVKERHNSLEKELKAVQKETKKWTFNKVVYRLACVMFPIGFIFSLVTAYNGSWQTAWIYMLITVMNAGVVCSGEINNSWKDKFKKDIDDQTDHIINKLDDLKQ